MAKIIDFKTRKVLADLPTENKTPRNVRGFKVADGEHKGCGIIAKTETDAIRILLSMQNVSKKKAA